MASMSPIYVSPGGRLVTVFGGGNVALRKIRHFEGFRIRVVSLKALPEVEEAADEIILCEICPETVKEYVKGSFLAVAATDSKQINAMVRDAAMEAGVLVNSAHGGGDVLIPSVIKRRNYSVCVSSEGRVPAFPPYVVEVLEPFLDESFDSMMDVMVHVRPIVMECIPEQKDRAEALRRILHDEGVWERLRSGDVDSAKSLAEGMVRA
ncbi:MAG: bifunctional precorrin-2 dehydrogenase/sirohydrochlorin ferrochelatase [Candidatus Methanomethylophilaceae archaeon]|nr:bifunctional precorrin-2 dehydrogenase/sirohydrochlorin ferrochelatase [Candidatus Methanomethylophilaceae archaeon]